MRKMRKTRKKILGSEKKRKSAETRKIFMSDYAWKFGSLSQQFHSSTNQAYLFNTFILKNKADLEITRVQQDDTTHLRVRIFLGVLYKKEDSYMVEKSKITTNIE